MCPPLSFDHRNIEIKQHRQTVTVQPPTYWVTTRLPSIRPKELEPSTYITNHLNKLMIENMLVVLSRQREVGP